MWISRNFADPDPTGRMSMLMPNLIVPFELGQANRKIFSVRNLNAERLLSNFYAVYSKICTACH